MAGSLTVRHSDMNLNSWDGLCQKYQRSVSFADFSCSAGNWGPPARFQDILTTIRQVFARDVRAEPHFLFADITLPSSSALRDYLAASPGQKGVIYLPVPLIQAWLWALKNTPTYILATQPI